MFSTGHRMIHRPGSPDYGAPLHNVCAGGIYPADVYTQPRLYGAGEPGFAEAALLIFRLRRQADTRVTIYRAAPSGKFETGDWVTIAEPYAWQHAAVDDDPTNDLPVWSTEVRARELWTDGNSLLEWGYWGPNQDGVNVLRDDR